MGRRCRRRATGLIFSAISLARLSFPHYLPSPQPLAWELNLNLSGWKPPCDRAGKGPPPQGSSARLQGLHVLEHTDVPQGTVALQLRSLCGTRGRSDQAHPGCYKATYSLKMVGSRVSRELGIPPFLEVFKVSLDGAPSSLFLSKGNWNR